MDSLETESLGSNNSSESVPKDYSLPSSTRDSGEGKKKVIGKSITLNFGVDRLLALPDKIFETKLDENLTRKYQSVENENLNFIEDQSLMESSDLLQQQLASSKNMLSQNFVLKPFPLRFGRNENGFSTSYLQSNLRKVSMTSSISNSASFINTNLYHHNILRLPMLQSTTNSIAQFYNQKMSKMTSNESKSQLSSNGTSNPKRKRSWSRAVFSSLQRKGLERQFEFQKYITKPDRKKLAARLGLKDAQVKVWFQNRRMKWRHSTRGTATTSKIGDSSLEEVDDNGVFTSSSDEDIDIDVVTDN